MLKKRRNDPGKGALMAKKIARLMTNKHVPEEDDESEVESTDSGDGEKQVAPRIVDFDEDEYELPEGPSTDFRKRNIKLLSEQSDRYKGVIARRSDYLHDSEEEEEDDDDDDEDDNDKAGEEEESDETSFDEEEYQGESEEECSFNEDEDAADSEESEVESEVEVMSKVCQQTQVQKGVCVQNQLGIWERLLEMRLHMQKLVNHSNQMAMEQQKPLNVEKDQLLAEKESKLRQQTTDNILQVLKGLLDVQQALTQRNSETSNALKDIKTVKCRPVESTVNLEEIDERLQARFDGFRNYRDEVLLKWDDRTRILTGAVKSINAGETYNVLNKIQHVLNNKSDLIKKSQLCKTGQDTETSGDAAAEINPEVYDDREFYHQQLRELIEYKANSGSNVGNISKQLLELQKIRKKMKKTVNTKASKGRRLRYTVHNKLISFMAPKNTERCSDEYKDELFKSLFA